MAVSAKDMVEIYLQAEIDVLAGKTVSFGGRTLGMAELPQIRDGRKEWEQRVVQQNRRGRDGNARAVFE